MMNEGAKKLTPEQWAMVCLCDAVRKVRKILETRGTIDLQGSEMKYLERCEEMLRLLLPGVVP